ncbi:MAG: PAS domain-containing protein [Candidatus Falkowbacteria bacterium]
MDTQSDSQVALHYIRTFSDTAREPFLILNADMIVAGANESFYKNFKVKKEDTENKLIYELGSRQWDIPELRHLLEEILPEKKVFNNFEITHNFPDIGLKIMLLNARQLDDTKQILLAIEDITLKRKIQVKLADYITQIEADKTKLTIEAKARIEELIDLNNVITRQNLQIKDLEQIISKQNAKDALDLIISEK